MPETPTGGASGPGDEPFGLDLIPGGEREAARPTGPQMLLLRVGDREFALPVEHVREVVDTPPITKVPLAPAAIAGVAAVRGEIVPVLDLGLRIRGRPTVASPRLVTVERKGHEGRIGLLADDVIGITQVAAEDDIESLPTDAAEDLPEGVASGMFSPAGDRVIVVLRLEGLLAIEEREKES